MIQARKYMLSLLAVLLLGSPMGAYAQKKEIQAAKDQVKAGKDLEKAQASMQKLLKDSANRGDKKIWSVLFESVKKQYEQGNEKLYLKQKYDTLKLFDLTRQLFVVAQDLDSVEMIPDRKGKVSLEYRKSHAEYLSQIRSNLFNGGIWLIRKQKYADAYRFFDQYVECAHLPMFASYNYSQKDKHLAIAAYYAVYSGYKMHDSKATLHHSYEALKDTAHYNYMLQYLAETYKLEHDSVRYLNTLREGFERAPKFPYFFPRLVEYYADENQLDSAMSVVDKALRVDSLNALYLNTKSTLYLNQGMYEACINFADKALEVDDSLADAYYNAGIAYFTLAVNLDKNTQLSRRKYTEIQGYYKKALPYLVKFRSLAPDSQSKWAFPLYTIYLNLNMGREFDEIDQIMKQLNKNK